MRKTDWRSIFFSALGFALVASNSHAADFAIADDTEALSVSHGRDGNTLVAKGNSKGQTFELTKPGSVGGLILGAADVASAADLTVQVFALEGGEPFGEALHSQTGDLSEGMQAGDSVVVHLDPPLSLSAGNYAMVLSTVKSNLRFHLSRGYEGGCLIRRNDSTKGKWAVGNGVGSDLLFRLIGSQGITSEGPAGLPPNEAPLEWVRHENPVFEPRSLDDLERKPNIITVMVDDLGWNQIGVPQATFGTHPDMYVTPNLARLANEGLCFTNAYAQPNCAPTRAAMLSGQYPTRIHNNVYVVGSLNRFGGGGPSKEKARFVGPEQSEDVAAEAVTVAEALRENGYATAHIGKYHVGGHRGEETLPENVGFDMNVGGFTQGHQPVCFATQTDENLWGFRGLGRGDFDRFAEPYATEYLERYGFPLSLAGTPKHVSDALADAMEETVASFAAADKPFYLQVHPYAVHGPVRSRPDLQEGSDGDPFVGFVKSVDLILGRLLSAIEDPNGDGDKSDSIVDHTLVLFTSDNGGTHKDNLPLRGVKGMFTEGGIRVPLIARWPGRIPANTVTDHLVHSVDYYPTYLQLAGGTWHPSPEVHPLDGFSFADVLVNPNDDSPRKPIFYLFPGYLDRRAQPCVTAIEKLGKSQFKLIYSYETDGWELYNLTTDIRESRNIADQQPEVVSRLAQSMHQWLMQDHLTWRPKYPIAKETGEPAGPPLR
ncbi:sulfatase-like hydrolase/transferase [Novipirellula artificiosorum]|uniref:Arylsulfatase n=1 Tax=Novipirellula artificiosorum TaxID=2528016 RepID=A0A5C6D5V2_9BACT|nr:sulfatase-like hydrolase/transferase [Novipirellula artificiosorum]TWU31184.1 Arylsulfatase [Novipirellula artificiosorum]